MKRITLFVVLLLNASTTISAQNALDLDLNASTNVFTDFYGLVNDFDVTTNGEVISGGFIVGNSNVVKISHNGTVTGLGTGNSQVFSVMSKGNTIWKLIAGGYAVNCNDGTFVPNTIGLYANNNKSYGLTSTNSLGGSKTDLITNVTDSVSWGTSGTITTYCEGNSNKWVGSNGAQVHNIARIVNGDLVKEQQLPGWSYVTDIEELQNGEIVIFGEKSLGQNGYNKTIEKYNPLTGTISTVVSNLSSIPGNGFIYNNDSLLVFPLDEHVLVINLYTNNTDTLYTATAGVINEVFNIGDTVLAICGEYDNHLMNPVKVGFIKIKTAQPHADPGANPEPIDSSKTQVATSTTSQKSLDLQLFPNPVVNQIFISPNFNENYNVAIFSVNGQQIYSFIESPGERIFDVSALEKGSYVITITTNESRYSEIFVKI